MQAMFSYTENFNQPLNSWNTSSVTDMSSMFSRAKSFNQSLDKWDTSKVKKMYNMFESSPLEKNPPKWYREN